MTNPKPEDARKQRAKEFREKNRDNYLLRVVGAGLATLAQYDEPAIMAAFAASEFSRGQGPSPRVECPKCGSTWVSLHFDCAGMGNGHIECRKHPCKYEGPPIPNTELITQFFRPVDVDGLARALAKADAVTIEEMAALLRRELGVREG